MANIVVLDDDPNILKPILKRLKDAGHESRAFSNAEEGWQAIQSAPPDLILLDRKMPEMSGDVIQKKLRENSRLAQIPVVFLTGKDTPREKIHGLRLGVDDYVTKPFDMGELLARIENILERRKILDERAWRDKLTSCLNREAFESHFATLFKGAQRYGRAFSIVITDVNEFKRVNDLLGHQAGDQTLVQVSQVLKKCLREADLISRYGGDEFVILLPETAEEGAQKLVDRISLEISKLPARRGPAGEILKTGLSFGSATYQSGVNSSDELFHLADKRMYQSKFQDRSSEKSKKQVLVVEDDSGIRKALLFRLRQAGFEALTADDGEAAVRIARAIKPDLILLDLMLPKLSGEEVCKTIREDDDAIFSKTPIIMLTAKAAEADQIVGRVIGADCYMTKPFDMNEVTRNVMKYIRS